MQHVIGRDTNTETTHQVVERHQARKHHITTSSRDEHMKEKISTLQGQIFV